MQSIFTRISFALILLIAKSAAGRSERGELGFAISAEGDTSRLAPVSSHYANGGLNQRWRSLGRVGGNIHYGLSDKVSLGLGVMASLPTDVSATAPNRKDLPEQSVVLTYRDIIIPASLAITFKRVGMFFVQSRLESGLALTFWRPTSLVLAPRGSFAAQRFDPPVVPGSWSATHFARLGIPLVWRLHDHLSAQWMPHVSLVGSTQWQIGVNFEVSALRGG